MDLIVRNATLDDLNRLAEIEEEAFPPAEAASKASYRWRLQHFPQYCFVGEKDGVILGAVVGRPTVKELIEDEIYEPVDLPIGETVAILSVLTDLKYRKQGIAQQVMEVAIEEYRRMGIKNLSLTCKEHLLHYYAKFGFEEVGVSKSVHGGALWYDMKMAVKND